MADNAGKTAPPDGPLTFLAVPLAWLIPGAGHLVMGQRARGVLFFAVIHALFATGLILGGIRAINPKEQPIWTYTQFLAGWPAVVGYRAERASAAEIDALPERYKEEYRSGGRSREQDIAGGPEGAEARKKAFDAFAAKHPNLVFNPKVQDIGSVYCGIAGMLNLLVVFDVLLRVTGGTRHPSGAPAGPQADGAEGGAK